MAWTMCLRCGGQAYLRGPDDLDYCNECGIVEGNTKLMEDDYERFNKQPN